MVMPPTDFLHRDKKLFSVAVKMFYIGWEGSVLYSREVLSQSNSFCLHALGKN